MHKRRAALPEDHFRVEFSCASRSDTMQFNVAQLLKEPTGATRRYELNENLDGLDPELRFLGPLVGAVTLLRTNSGVLVTGELSTATQATCRRCLDPIAQEVRFQLEESFRPLLEVVTGRYIPPEEFEGEEEDLEDAALIISERHILDLSEVVRQAIWLGMPMYPGCNWVGAGECPNLARRLADLGNLESVEVHYDADRETDGEGRDEEIDPRWAALLKLRKPDNNVDES
jgi:uncharacterized metal-binding protein YceD (DUF177 family)